MIAIRRAVASDAAALSLIGSAVFLETYATLMLGVDIVAHCAVKNARTHYEAWLAEPAVAIWLAETETGAPAGYCVLLPATLPEERPQPGDYEVVRIYVLSRFHGEQVGHRLMRTAVEEARQREAPRVVLGLMRENARAMAFYIRQGFAEVGSRKFKVGSTVFDDAVMALDLGPSIPRQAG